RMAAVRCGAAGTCPLAAQRRPALCLARRRAPGRRQGVRRRHVGARRNLSRAVVHGPRCRADRHRLAVSALHPEAARRAGGGVMAGTDTTRPSWEGGPAIVLVEPQLGENIGMSARAMLNCGLTDMRVVNPRQPFPNDYALAAAVGS